MGDLLLLITCASELLPFLGMTFPVAGLRFLVGTLKADSKQGNAQSFGCQALGPSVKAASLWFALLFYSLTPRSPREGPAPGHD